MKTLKCLFFKKSYNGFGKMGNKKECVVFCSSLENYTKLFFTKEVVPIKYSLHGDEFEYGLPLL